MAVVLLPNRRSSVEPPQLLWKRLWKQCQTRWCGHIFLKHLSKMSETNNSINWNLPPPFMSSLILLSIWFIKKTNKANRHWPHQKTTGFHLDVPILRWNSYLEVDTSMSPHYPGVFSERKLGRLGGYPSSHSHGSENGWKWLHLKENDYYKVGPY